MEPGPERPLNIEDVSPIDPPGIIFEGESPDPTDELMDFLGLPRGEGKRALWEAARASMPVEFWGEMLDPNTRGDK